LRTSGCATLGLVSGLAALAVLGGCSTAKTPSGGGHHPTTGAPATYSATTTSTTTSTTAPAPTASTTASTTSAAETSAFGAAKAQWVAGAKADAANQGQYWTQAATDLSPFAGYSSDVADLRQLAALPDTDDTPTQMAEATADVNTLNSFFATPGLYS
jgi:predicted lipid-binding transport protein (Tim44 family)